jgi:hypothetical protein
MDSDYQEIEAIVFHWIDDSTCPSPNNTNATSHWDWNGTTQDCNLFPRIRGPHPLGPRLVRHAFHDACGVSDGFIDLSRPDNAGLEASTQVLDAMYQTAAVTLTGGGTISQLLNKADFAAWSYIAAVRYTAMLQNNQHPFEQGNEVIPPIPITFGRAARVNGSVPVEVLPDAQTGGQAVQTFFWDTFGFTADEAATILGAHTLGGASRPTSGYVGSWVASQRRDILNNGYYRALLNPRAATQGWELQRIGTGNETKFQWRHSCADDGSGCRDLMLHVDMALFRDIDAFLCPGPDAATGCRLKGEVRNACPTN